MVKLFFIFLLSLSLYSDDILMNKIQSLMEVKVFKANKAYIDIIFTPKKNYYVGNRVDVVKVVQTLKSNGLLNLFFKKPSKLTLHFKTNASPLFFVKVLGDALSNMGYYRYITKKSNLDNTEFTWTIGLTSEYATDPLILQKELNKNGCSIVDIQRNTPKEWTYIVDMEKGLLNVEVLKSGVKVKLKRSLYAKWVNVSKIKKLKIKSSIRNSWYPYIAYYDSSLHLLKVIKRDTKRSSIVLNMRDNTHYLKISDIYTLKNIRDDLTLSPIGSR